MNTQLLDLLNNASATGAGQNWRGGKGSFLVAGTFGGATVSLQVLGPDKTTWTDVGVDTTLTAGPGGNFELPPCQLRAAVSGGSPSGLYAKAASIQ